jgi:pyruvate kinase
MTRPEPRVRRAKIVATLGPATDGHEQDLVAAGLDVARLNFSHGEHHEHAQRCAAIRAAAAAVGRTVAVMQDLQGPKIRVGTLRGGGPVKLVEGQPFTITTRDVSGTARRVSSTYPNLPADVKPGNQLLLDDGKIRLVATEVTEDEVRTRVENGGLLGEHKGINLPGVSVSAPALTTKDRADLRFGLGELDVDYVALSFIRSADEVREARALAKALGHDVPLIVKLEKGEAIEDLEAILNVANGVMVARGDLGVELAPEQVPMLQKTIIRRARHHGIPVITATQMLESMRTDESPTRAEATDVANAVWDGTDSITAETATGRHPVRVIQMMDRITRAAESAEQPARDPDRRRAADRRRDGYAAAVTHAARVLAEDLEAAAIVGLTRSGRTAELLSRDRASVPIVAFSPDARTCRRLALWWGVTPVHHQLVKGLEASIASMTDHLIRCGIAQPGEVAVITGAHPFQSGTHTNFVKYEVLGRPS